MAGGWRWVGAAALGAWLGSLGCAPPEPRCDDDTDCLADYTCGARGICEKRAATPDAGTQLDGRCVVWGAASSPTPGAPAPLVVGALLPKTNATGGSDLRGRLRENAIRLVIDELNPPTRQGIAGRRIHAIVCDASSDPAAATELAEHLIQQGAQAIITSGSAETVAVSAVTIPAQVLLMSSSATSPEITTLLDRPDGETVGLVWRSAPSDALQGSVVADEILNATTSTPCIQRAAGVDPKVAVFEVNDVYGQGLYEVFRQRVPLSQHQAVLFDRDGDVTAAVDEAAAYGPQTGVVIAFPADAVRILDAAASRPALQGITWFFTDSSKSPDLLRVEDSDQVDGACGTAPARAASGSEAYVWFAQQYQQKFSEDPQSASFVANTFDAMMLIALAGAHAAGAGEELTGLNLAYGLTHLSSAGGMRVVLDPPHFNQAAGVLGMGTDVNVEGASGPLDFDNSAGEAPASIEVWQVQDGGFATLKTVAP